MKNDSITDSDVTALMSSNEEEALSRIYIALVSDLRRLAAHKGAEEPDDVVQDVFVKFIEAVRRRRFCAKTPDDIVAFLKTLVCHRVIDDYRKAQARCRDMMVDLDEFMLPVTSSTLYVIDAHEAADLQARAQRAVLATAKFEDKTRGIFIASVIHDRPISDVAADFRVSAGLVRQIRHRGLAKVKAYIDAVA